MNESFLIEYLPVAFIFFQSGMSFLLGILILYRRGKAHNAWYAACALILGIIFGMIGLAELLPAGDPAIYVIKSIYAFAAVLPPVFFLFLCALYGKMSEVYLWKRALIAGGFFAIVATIYQQGVFISSITEGQGWSHIVEFGPGVGAFVAYIALYMGICITILMRTYVESAGVFRSHFLYLLLGLLISGTFAFFTGIFLPLLGFFDLIWMTVFVLAAYAAVIGFFLTRYNFWNTRLFIAELFVGTIILLFVFDTAMRGEVRGDIVSVLMPLVLAVTSGVVLVRSVRKEAALKEHASRLLAELGEANAQLRTLDEKKSNFVSAASFYLRDPLTTIRGYASLLLEGTFGDLSDRVQSAIRIIFQSSKNLSAIVDGFTDILKLERGEAEYSFAPIDVKHLMETILPEMAVSAEKAGIALYFETDGEREYIIYADSVRIRQAISNIIDNAIKYTPKGYVELSLSKDKMRGVVRLLIRDTGMGMDSETIANIFSKFNRGEDAKKAYTGGAGLGLYVAREILKKHNASIRAESAGKGKGTVFYIEYAAYDKKI